MKVTLNWLKQYVDVVGTPEELRERLTLIGIEVEGMQQVAGEFDGIVVAQILSTEKHPHADKLSVCRVTDGRGERVIVCGAKNYQVGDKVPLALPGCALPTSPGQPPFVIKVGKLRGVESHGMMCSPKELGLAEDTSGLLILPSDAQVGQSFAEHLGRAAGDVVFDLEITPNRPDLNSVIGIAREISAVMGCPLRWPAVDLENHLHRSDLPPTDQCVAVRIDDAALCPRYTARLLRGIKIGPSPDWLLHRLEKVGLRSINNVVDVTNYVMLEVGQPLHAFDYHLLARAANTSLPTIVVRHAGAAEKFTTLDGQERALTDSMLVIADETKAVALAGIMGGQNSEINHQTVDVLIESACFKPQSIRATARKLELKSDASYRFERGSDIGICDWASQRAAQLILETAGGQLAPGVVDAFPGKVTPRSITLRFARTNHLLGIEIPPAQQVEFLRRLELVPLDPGRTESASAAAQTPAVPTAETSATFCIPTFRVDLKREVDLIEEVGRLYGVDRIPSRLVLGTLGSNDYDRCQDELGEVRRILTGLGLHEAQGQTLIPEKSARWLSATFQPLQNPLSGDMNVLRPSLLPGLLDSLQYNLNRKVADVALFEIGRVFFREGEALQEKRRLAVAITGRRYLPFWYGEDREACADLFDLKGILEEFFDQFGAKGLVFEKQPTGGAFYSEFAHIRWGKEKAGEAGQLLPALARQYDVRNAVWLAELDLDLLIGRRNRARVFKPLPAYPAIRRDIAMVVPEATTHAAVLAAIKQAKPQHLEQVDLFDVFRGQNVPPGHKSMAYALVYRQADRTLTDAEVNTAHQRVVQVLQETLAAVIREA
jgi:phenylalanyl-tRNA synthetase beta chain